MPHTGTDLVDLEPRLVSPWLARKDADWWIDQLYSFAHDLNATIIHTSISRTMVDVNRDPSGATLYPGQNTTELCPTTTFDGEPLYVPGKFPDHAEIAERRKKYFDPYHDALQVEIERLRAIHPKIVLYDCHSIRSVIPRLFEGELPNFNFGTNDGKSCDASLSREIESIITSTNFSSVVNGRFKGGYITRHYAKPEDGVHAVQMELACRGYLREPVGAVNESNWPTPYDKRFAEPMRAILMRVLDECIRFCSPGL
ncbi:MAG TPA: N-formylglutamate deformylase [Tepidisphaeraceae bacterium]|nr:N-formylglutamate deformylase [Tepidisphaeraceae bacterium]